MSYDSTRRRSCIKPLCEKQKISKFMFLYILWQFSIICCNARSYTLKNYSDVASELSKMASVYPDYVEVFTAQERYGLDSPGQCGDEPCKQWVIHVTDIKTLDLDPERPEVFFSGCLHGDEVVGPTAVLEAIWLLLRAVTCARDIHSLDCLDSVLQSDPEYIPWLAKLVSTRSLYAMPATNALGFYSKRREEHHVDPNRDFPYHHGSQKCMQSITARAVNEVWREHMFQLALTFHGGMVAVAFEWGDLEHLATAGKDASPDDDAQVQLAGALSAFGGGFTANGAEFAPYPHQTLNSLVYPVAGGMEDWAYAGSWDGPQTMCNSQDGQFSSYPSEKTIYSESTLRAFNILVETSDQKTPPDSELGGSEDQWNPQASDNGHVARNIRLSLLVLDAVQPYLDWSESIQSKANITDSRSPGSISFQDREQTGLNFNISWRVGGCFSVNSTRVLFGRIQEPNTGNRGLIGTLLGGIRGLFGGKRKMSPHSFQFLGNEDQLKISRNLIEDIELLAGTAQFASPNQYGNCRWGEEHSSKKSLGPLFEAQIGMDNLKGGVYFIMTEAVVDQGWADNDRPTYPTGPPQSHIVNVRVNPSWNHTFNGRVIRGHLRWYSVPIFIQIPYSDAKETQPKGFDAIQAPSNHDDIPSSTERTNETLKIEWILWLSWSAITLVSIFACFWIYRVMKSKLATRNSTRTRSGRTVTREYAMVPVESELTEANYEP